jgi:hypothetical protein
MAMTLYAGQILRIEQTTGAALATYLTITDDDTRIASREAGTIYNICGVNLANPPMIDRRLISGTLLDGSTFTLTAAHFTTRGKDFYILPADFAPETVASVTSSVQQGAVPGFDYFTHGLTVDDEPLLTGRALHLRFDAAGQATSINLTDAIVSDDDPTLQTVETGEPAAIMFGPGFATVLGAGTRLVRVFYHGATGDGSFVALRITAATADGSQAWYLPQGGFDLGTVQSFIRQSVLAANADGLPYADFGLGQSRQTTAGTAAADFLQGGLLHDAMTGKAGDDTLTGGLGADLLDGGNGNDTLIGGKGADSLHGGNDDDSISGHDGDDTMQGAWGDDTLLGGAGNDRVGGGSDDDFVAGGAGNDTVTGFDDNDILDDGAGTDLLNGGLGADTFILRVDGSTDRIVDFQDGQDHLSLGLAFASLTITTLSPGHVQILHGGDILLLDDPARLLTAADLTEADFL